MLLRFRLIFGDARGDRLLDGVDMGAVSGDGRIQAHALLRRLDHVAGRLLGVFALLGDFGRHVELALRVVAAAEADRQGESDGRDQGLDIHFASRGLLVRKRSTMLPTTVTTPIVL